jgi:integrase
MPPDLECSLPLAIPYSTLRTYFEKAREQAGMSHVRFHDLRHTAASWWAMSGANLAIIRDLLGHSTLAMTSRYTHLFTDDLKRVAAKVTGRKRGAKVSDDGEASITARLSDDGVL